MTLISKIQGNPRAGAMVSRICEELPLLSAEDIVWILEKYLPQPQATEEGIQKALARRLGARNDGKGCAKK